MKPIRPLAVLVSTLLLLGACRHAADAPIRANPEQDESVVDLDFDPFDFSKAKSSPLERITFNVDESTKAKFLVASFELSDKGYLFRPTQAAQISRLVRKESNGDGTIVIALVHGWKHNATPCDDNLSCFRSVLRRVAAEETLLAKAKGRAPRAVIGAYVGWRGLSYCSEPAKEFSFYDRKRQAHWNGQLKARDILQTLRTVVAEMNDTREAGTPPSRLITVGHSFGAAVVFSAVAPELIEDLEFKRERATRKGLRTLEPIEPFGDLVVLVNPAFEAQRYAVFDRAINDIQREGRSFDPKQKPVLVTISSEGDGATHYFFPVGQGLNLVFQPLKLLRFWSWGLHTMTVGNYPPYRTHDALARTPAEAKSRREREASSHTCYGGVLRDPTVCDCSNEVNLNELIARLETAPPAKGTPYGNVDLRAREGLPKNNPFWVIKASKGVIKDHGDLFNPTLVTFLYEVVGEAAFGLSTRAPADATVRAE